MPLLKHRPKEQQASGSEAVSKREQAPKRAIDGVREDRQILLGLRRKPCTGRDWRSAAGTPSRDASAARNIRPAGDESPESSRIAASSKANRFFSRNQGPKQDDKKGDEGKKPSQEAPKAPETVQTDVPSEEPETADAAAAEEPGSSAGGETPLDRLAGVRKRLPPSFLRRVVSSVALTCLVAVVVAGFCLGSMWAYGRVMESDFFLTRHIDVSGNVRLSREAILRIGGLSEGVSSLSVNISDVERRLRKTPWISSVSVKRLLPDRFVVQVEERMPSFWVRGKEDGRLCYADEKGTEIALVESSNFMSLPLLSIEDGCREAIPYLARLMRDMRSGILPVETGAIATVDVSSGRGVEIYLEDREMRLAIAPDDWEGNLARLGVTMGDLARRRELGGVREVRAADGCVWVLKRQSAQD